MKNILTKKFYLSIDLAGRLESDHFIRGSYKEPRLSRRRWHLYSRLGPITCILERPKAPQS